MNVVGSPKETILLLGSDKLTYSIAACLQKAGFTVMLSTTDVAKAQTITDRHRLDSSTYEGNNYAYSNLIIRKEPDFSVDIDLAILITEENLAVKKQAISGLEKNISANTIIAVNTESIPLRSLQENVAEPGRIIGVNWTEPAHTTFFLEIIANQSTRKSCIDYVATMARQRWGKDPYVIQRETGVRMKLMAALIREAFYLVENGYASVEDIDRACRNDAGYYLPFAGNLRYMDLMGTYAYGMVMKDLNPELSTSQNLPDFFTQRIQANDVGMDAGKGFYGYEPGEPEKWANLTRQFSFQISELMEKYPFDSQSEEVVEPVKNEVN
ncbi:3-hydroxyacyl-CoA dehydrogenase [Spirosoma sp. BT702]|uniref:3-hydroxyacyl-CoA dehydrogenase n=2 Tax=Spirosoma profusum TaxID=2771354 RepID=A0A926Y2Z3_9BACT|nr:3-hydroxyacyl-CoA dehydrogenase [Spirosoma profusum]